VGHCAATRQGAGSRHVHERHEGSQPWPGLGRWDEASRDARPAVDTWAAATTRPDLGESEAITTEISAQGVAAAAATCAAWKHTEDAAAMMLAIIEDAWAAEDIVAEVAS
jgi:hypothetical protein